MYTIPEDNHELTSKNGPFTTRRDVFDSCRLTKINISDEEIRKAILNIKKIDPNMAVDIKLKDISEKIKILCNKVKTAKQDSYSEVVSETIKEDIGLITSIANDIEKRVDHEDVILTFNNKTEENQIIDKFKKVLYIADNKEKILTIFNIFDMLKNSGNLEGGKIKESAEKFILGEGKLYDEILKKYKIIFNEYYKKYETLYNSIISEIKVLPEWNNLKNDQKNEVEKSIYFIKLNDFVFDGLKVRDIGNLDDLRRIHNNLYQSKIDAVSKVHSFNDINTMKKEVESTQATKTTDAEQNKDINEMPEKLPEVSTRISRKLKYYSQGKIINIDSLEKLSELNDLFDEIQQKIKEDIEKGKKITLEL